MKAKVFSYSEMLKEAEKLLRKEAVNIRLDCIDTLLHIAAWAIWDTDKKITKSKLKKILEKMSYKAGFISDGTVSIEEVKQLLKDEAELVIGFVDEMRKKGAKNEQKGT